MTGSRRSFWLIFIISILSIATGSFFVIRHILSPSDGARLAPGGNNIGPEGLSIQVFQKVPGGLRNGDLVLEVGGRTIESWSSRLFERGPAPAWTIGETVLYRVERDGAIVDVQVVLDSYPIKEIFLGNWGTIIFGLVFLIVGGFIIYRKPNSQMGQVLFLSAAGLAGSTAWSFGLTVSDFMDGTGFWLYKAATFLFYNLAWTAGLHFALLFPQPIEILRKRWLVPTIYIVPFLLEFVYLWVIRQGTASNLVWLSRWAPVEGLHAAVFLFATVIVFYIQFRRASGSQNRQQIRWVVLAGLLAGGGGLVFYLLPPFLGLEAISPNIIGLLVLTYPISIAIAILRHNLFNIETLINRTLVYGTLTAVTMLIYVGIVSFVGMFISGAEQGLVAFVTTGIIALIFQPFRIQLQRIVNRFMYGDRDDPYNVLKTLGNRLQDTLAPRDVIPAIVETVAATLKLPYAGITLFDGDCIDFGVLPARVEPISFQLSYHGEAFGRLEVAPRSASEPLNKDEIRLINDLARQIEVAVHDVRLNTDLQRSRQRLVTAREEERRRIRRDLHDGLGPQLASQLLTLEAMDKLLKNDPESARVLLKNLKSQSQTAIADIRTLIYGLRPPALDDLGLIEALQQEINQFPEPPKVIFKYPDHLPPFPAAIELAIYRITQEAVNNVFKHAHAANCTVQIEISPGQINVTIKDDGSGLPEARKVGIGMQTMRERAEELGGAFIVRSQLDSGTIISASIPIIEETND